MYVPDFKIHETYQFLTGLHETYLVTYRTTLKGEEFDQNVSTVSDPELMKGV